MDGLPYATDYIQQCTATTTTSLQQQHTSNSPSIDSFKETYKVFLTKGMLVYSYCYRNRNAIEVVRKNFTHESRC
jgi:hypothetical protein